MSLQLKHGIDLIKPETFRWKVLVYSLPGEGKTTWLADAPNLGIAACETGHGKGILSIADRDPVYVEPGSYADFEAVCSGRVFPNVETVALDSLSSMTKTFIKDYALSIPRTGQQSEKRARGLPELDDYGIMGEVTRRLLQKLLDSDKHVIVTATLRIEKPDPQTGQGAFLLGPDLPGQLFMGSTAMFDTVMFLKHRSILKTPNDPKSRMTQRYFLTAPDGSGAIVKCRSIIRGGPPILDQEEIFDLETGAGSFPKLLEKIKTRYAAFAEVQKAKKAA